MIMTPHFIHGWGVYMNEMKKGQIMGAEFVYATIPAPKMDVQRLKAASVIVDRWEPKEIDMCEFEDEEFFDDDDAVDIPFEG